MKQIFIFLSGIVFAGLIVLGIWVATEAHQQKVAAQSQIAATSTDIVDMTRHAQIGFQIPPNTLLFVNGSSSQSICFFYDLGKCQITVAQFVAYLPMLHAFADGNFELPANDVYVNVQGGASTTPLMSILNAMVAQYGSLTQPLQ
jgi:hypothetical protein